MRTFCRGTIYFYLDSPSWDSGHGDSTKYGPLSHPHFTCIVQNPQLGSGCLAWEWRVRLGGGRGRFGSQGKPCQVFQEAVFRRSQVVQSRLPGCPSQTKESKHGQRDAAERQKLQQVRVLEARASRKETSRAKHGTGPLPLLGRPPCARVLSCPTAAPGPCLGPSPPAHPPCSPQVQAQGP